MSQRTMETIFGDCFLQTFDLPIVWAAKLIKIGGQKTVRFNGMWPCMMSMFASSIYIHAATSMCIRYTRYMIMAIHELLLLFDLMTTTMLPKSSCFSPFFFSSTIKARLSWTSRVGKIGNGDHLKDPLENNRNTTNHQICLGREGVPNS